uniref:Uncharacterized protein n=1 Tax=Anguilla anguilla TaxID=7936 RepID=A0A0E9RMG3_ANGAN
MLFYFKFTCFFIIISFYFNFFCPTNVKHIELHLCMKRATKKLSFYY